jgi:hypothetical protein
VKQKLLIIDELGFVPLSERSAPVSTQPRPNLEVNDVGSG